MSEFFTEVNGTPFQIFGHTHMLISLLTISISILLFIHRDKLRGFKYKESVRYILAAILFINMTVYYISKTILGIYDWKVDLPLHFCFITGYLFIYILITGNKKLYKLIYFFTFAGPVPAMIWPDLAFNYDRYIFWQFVISHHFMLLSSVYVLIVLEYKVFKKDILKAFIVGNIIVGVITVFNNTFNTNYIMIEELPAQIYRMYPFVQYLSPIFWLEMVAILAIMIAYIPARLINKLDNNNEEECMLEDNEFKYV